ncbi:MAG: ABC transporter permease, partial [Rubrivivax sp.]|nr:ABC transporter permease [Pyrinomonadaceae bacterium]
EGQTPLPPGQEHAAYRTVATENYFGILGIPLRAGRLFDRSDRRDSTPVIIINETMARRYWPDESPIGRKIFLRSNSQPVAREIVGVVGDVRHNGLEGEPRPELFQPYAQNATGGMTLVVRTASDDSLAVVPGVKGAIWEINKNQTIYKAAALESLLTDSLKARRFSLLLLGAFAGIALVIAGVGIYGLISFTARQRTHEIGIRLALGAQGRDIVRMIVGEGLVLAALGVGVGLAGALALTRFLKSLLYGITPTDPLTYAALSALLFAVALAASYLPARRALKVDPVSALRYE